MNEQKTKIAFIIGTRAELIKTFPVMHELKNRNIPYLFIHTGQHSLGDLCEMLEVKHPDAVLTEEPKTSSKFNAKQGKAIIWNLKLIGSIKKELKKYKDLKFVIYHGDTMTTATAAMATSALLNWRKRYKNVHLESGLRSWENKEPFPEEISRQIAGKFSDILFAPSEKAAENLKKYKKKQIYRIGNTILDSTDYALRIAEKRQTRSISNQKFALITVHRHENLKNKNRMIKIVEILTSIQIPSYFAMHDNTKKKLEEFNLLSKLEQSPNIYIIKPMDYPDFIYQLSKCSLIVCDGGSMQEESLIFSKPCIVLRHATERQEGLETNFQYLCKLDVEKTKSKIEEYLSSDFKIQPFVNPYGKKGVSKKMVDILNT
jgi:UDP-N-acetylglucosamine 2-epimerase (non-hydrolysing)